MRLNLHIGATNMVYKSLGLKVRGLQYTLLLPTHSPTICYVLPQVADSTETFCALLSRFLLLFPAPAVRALRSTIMFVPHQGENMQSGAFLAGLLYRTSFDERVLFTLGLLTAVVAGSGVVSYCSRASLFDLLPKLPLTKTATYYYYYRILNSTLH